MTDVTIEIEPHLTRLTRYARSLVRNPALADDLVQDTVMRALEKAHLYQSDTNLRGWLVTIMHNEHVNAVRRSMRGAVLVSDDQIAGLGRPSTQEAPIELREIRGAVQLLPKKQREPLILHWLHGVRMSFTVSTIWRRWLRCSSAACADCQPSAKLSTCDTFST